MRRKESLDEHSRELTLSDQSDEGDGRIDAAAFAAVVAVVVAVAISGAPRGHEGHKRNVVAGGASLSGNGNVPSTTIAQPQPAEKPPTTTTSSTTQPEQVKFRALSNKYFSIQVPLYSGWEEAKPQETLGGEGFRYENRSNGDFVEFTYDSGTEAVSDRTIYYLTGSNGDEINLVRDANDKLKYDDCSSTNCATGNGKLEIFVRSDESDPNLTIKGHYVVATIGNERDENANTKDILDIVESFEAL